MEDVEFENEYRHLKILSGRWDMDDLFLKTYLETVATVNEETDREKRYNQLKRLKEMCWFQGCFVRAEYNRQISLGLDKLDEQSDYEGENLQ